MGYARRNEIIVKYVISRETNIYMTCLNNYNLLVTAKIICEFLVLK